ncbi:MAG: DNA-directed DNA polymerase II small subunit [Candidatus Altiarchaeota archaeon]|nr:DNA-directed DNA polymerase II small subunit [Candidatus Altiarchaeota archaeon]
MDKGEISQKALEYGLVLSTTALEQIIDSKIDYKRLFKKAKDDGAWFVTHEYIEKTTTTDKPDICESEGSEHKKHKACDLESKLIIHDSSDVTGKSTCAGTIDDFIQYFNSRYKSLKSVIQEHVEYKDVSTIEQVKAGEQKTKQKIVAIVNEKRESTRGFKFLDVEDPTGGLTVLIADKNDHLKAEYERILPDEVIGIEGILTGELYIANNITQPDIPLNHTKRYASEEVYAAFLSDIHVGSYLFLEKEFMSFIEWLNGRGSRREVADRLKYIFIAGDLVDGIGIYPDQESELTIPDIERQYEFLAMLLEDIPKHIEIIACMGNHDASRNAEPQPRVSKDLAGKLYEIPNVHVCGNPVRFSAHGVEVLMYHGTSMDTIIGSLSSCSYKNPDTAMVELLKRRHLVPTYGSDSISPENKDYLFIEDVPDVFHCGHVHTNGYTQYRGVTVINSGTWQAKTAYQERLGHQPTPARVPIMNLQNHEVIMLDFSANNE